jgi:hypothetical protein
VRDRRRLGCWWLGGRVGSEKALELGLPLDELREAAGVLEGLVESCRGAVCLAARGGGARAGVVHVSLQASEAVLEALDQAARVDLGQLAKIELDGHRAGLERDGHQSH